MYQIHVNVGRLPLDPTNVKQSELFHTVNEHAVDVLGHSEVGINWSHVP